VRHAHALFGRAGAFLGRALVRIPAAGEPPAQGWWPLSAGDDGKHAEELAAAARRAGRPPGAYGELNLSVTRQEGAHAAAAGPETPPRDEEETAMMAEAEPRERGSGGGVRAGLSRAARAPVHAVRALLPTSAHAGGGGGGILHRRSHRRGAASDDESSSGSDDNDDARAGRRRRGAAAHIHVAVVAGRNLLPSDFKAPSEGGDASSQAGPTSDPYVTARLLPGGRAEGEAEREEAGRRATAVKHATLNPLWEARAAPAILRLSFMAFIRLRMC
jgi:hypothetical protein